MSVPEVRFQKHRTDLVCRAPETSNERVHYRFLSTTGYYSQHSKILSKFILIHIINSLLISLLDIYTLYYIITFILL
jgi:hypothetical protein